MSDERGRFGFDGAEGHAFWVYSDATQEQAQATIEFSDLEDLKLFLQENLPGLFVSTPPADDVRYVSAEVVLAALAQMEDVAADRELFQGTKVSILRRRTVSLQQQIENQARPTPPADDVREALADSLEDFMQDWYDRWAGPGETWVVRDMATSIVEGWLPKVRPRGTVTDAEVEAAARAIYEQRDGEFDWDSLSSTFRTSSLPEARAALEAAAKARNA